MRQALSGIGIDSPATTETVQRGPRSSICMVFVRQRLLALLAAGCLLGLTGLPLALVQVWAWGSMYGRYVETMPVATALRFTLSGQELCGYCEFVDEAREAEASAASLAWAETRLLLPVRTEAAISHGRGAGQPIAGAVETGPERTEGPRGPPPRRDRRA